MMVTCNKERWEGVGNILRSALGAEAEPCGRTFDDHDRSTICPHEPLGQAGLVCKETDLFKGSCPHCQRKAGA